MENLSNDFATTLSGSMDNVTTTANVVSGTGAPAVNFRIKVDSEIMLVTGLGTGLNWTVQRGIEGTTAASHLSAATVAHVISKGGLDEYGFENMVAFFPGADTGESKMVGPSRQFNMYEEIIINGELIINRGSVNVVPLPPS